jgi:CubicO group peptidase (beta-lactamase class C family)
MAAPKSSISEILADVPSRFRGPGGAVAVIKNGELLGQKCWGYADLKRRIPMTADMMMPICSISKQMLCGLLTDLERTPTPAMVAQGDEPSKQFADQLRELLHPGLFQYANKKLTMKHLCNNQSGLRDYWALSVCWGANPEDRFSIAEHGPQVLDRLRNFHFKPGTQYSYANTNFFIIARVIEKVTGEELGKLLEERIFKPAGMKTAKLCADTAKHPPPVVGYEGDEETGFIPAVNRIEWAGDAGIVASLEDMVAYEQFIDRSARDPQSWYAINSQQQTFENGVHAAYGYGLGRQYVDGVLTVRHGGALRGFRLSRCYAPVPRISVVVLLNNDRMEPGEVSDYILKRLLGKEESRDEPEDAIEISPWWLKTWLDVESALAIHVSEAKPGDILFKYFSKPVKMRAISASSALGDGMTASLQPNRTMRVQIAKDNWVFDARAAGKPMPTNQSLELHGTYRCPYIDSVVHLSGSGGAMYAMFDGFLGEGPVHLLRPIGTDLWALACPRAMDHAPPGDWTLSVRRYDDGRVVGLTISNWLARILEYLKDGERYPHV